MATSVENAVTRVEPPIHPVGGFRLAPSESFLWGVRHRDDRLRVGTTGGAWAARLAMGLFASVLGLSLVLGGFNPDRTTVNGFPVKDGRPLIAAGVVVCVVVWLNTWRELRQQIVVSTDGLSIRHGMFRSTELAWADVRYVAVARSSRGDTRSEEGVEWPFVTTSAGRRIDVGGLRTLEETSLWSVGVNSGARQRIDLVHRFAVDNGVALDTLFVIDSEPPGLSAAARDGGVFAVGVLVTVLAAF